MSKKIGFSVFFTLSVIVACQSPSNNLNTNHVDSSNSQKSNFKVSDIVPDPEASLLNSPILTTPPDNVPDLEPQVISTSNPDNFVPPKVTLNFDYPPDDNLATVKGKIIVFYHNNDKFRVSTTESVSSLNISYQEQINSILKKYKVKGVHSYGYYDPADAKKVICKGKNFNKFHDNDDEDNKDEHNNKKDDTKDKNRFNTKSNDSDDNEQKCDSKNYSDSLITIQAISQEQQDVSKSIEGEFPDKLSIHIYDFPLNSDTKKISQEIRSLSFVRTAYAALKVGTNSEKPIEKVTNNEKRKDKNLYHFSVNSVSSSGCYDYYGCPSPTPPPQKCNLTADILGYTDSNTPSPDRPSDSAFHGSSSQDEAENWYLYNRHKIFDGWKVYGNTPMPKIAVIDTGFDNDSAAHDKPNYVGGYSVAEEKYSWHFWDPFKLTQGDIKEEPINNSNLNADDFSHGTFVASIIGSPKNNTDLAGISYGAQILPIKYYDPSENGSTTVLCRAIEEVAKDNSIDVINFSQGPDGSVAIGDPVLSRAIESAVSKGKVFVMAAGNSIQNISYSNNIRRIPGAIVVGSTSNRISNGGPVQDRVYRTDPNNRIHISDSSSFGELVDIAASGDNIYAQKFDPRPFDQRPNKDKKERDLTHGNGTSFACPIVASAAGLVKKLAQSNGVNLNPDQIRDIISYSGTISYDQKYSPRNVKEYLGVDLTSRSHSPYGTPNIRNLNLFNALTIAKNLSKYSVIIRQHNTDDYVISTANGNWQNYFDFRGYKSDEILGINNPNVKYQIDFKTYNVGGGYTYGYQLYYGKKYGGSFGGIFDYYVGFNFFDKLDGAAGLIGAKNNSNQCCGYLAGESQTVQQVRNSCN